MRTSQMHFVSASSYPSLVTGAKKGFYKAARGMCIIRARHQCKNKRTLYVEEQSPFTYKALHIALPRHHLYTPPSRR